MELEDARNKLTAYIGEYPENVLRFERFNAMNDVEVADIMKVVESVWFANDVTFDEAISTVLRTSHRIGCEDDYNGFIYAPNRPTEIET